MLSSRLLDDFQSCPNDEKGSAVIYEIKIRHLNQLVSELKTENQDLKSVIQHKQDILESILQNQTTNQFMEYLKNENLILKQKNENIQKQNENLLTTILLNEQTNAQSKKQFELYINRYERKIVELRLNLQAKQLQTQSLESRLQECKSLRLPFSPKYLEKYGNQISKYQILIQQMLDQKNRPKMNTLQENFLKTVLTDFNKNYQAPKKQKQSKNVASEKMVTDIRSHINQLNNQNFGQNNFMNQQKIELLFLKLHLELRQLKKKFQQKLDDISQLKVKDKVMKQGYHTITKEMEKVKIENCQLKIQLEHLDKKVKTNSELSILKSLANIKKNNKQNGFKSSSDISIDGNLSVGKNTFSKIGLPSETKNDTQSGDNKSHLYDEKIQNIEEILSLENSFDQIQDKNLTESLEKDDESSIYDENQEQISIQLDTSGFQVERSHYQVNETILSGLIDQKIF